MFHLGEEMENILAFKELVRADRGACFGTRDTSRLRPSPVRKHPIDRSLQDREKKSVPAMRVVKKKAK